MSNPTKEQQIPAAVLRRDDEGGPLPQMVAQHREQLRQEREATPTSKPLAQRLRERAAIREMEGGFPDAELFNEAAIALMPQDETAGDETLAQLHRIDVAARVYVENRTHGNYSRLCDALFDGRPAVEPFARQPSECKHEHAGIKCPDCGIDFVGTLNLPKLEYSEHCDCCRRNKITVDVFGRPAEKASCRHVFDFVPFKGVVCTRCGVAATTETIPPNHSAHHWIKQGAGAICDGCGLIGGDPSSSSEKASAFKCVCGEMHTLGDGHVCKSQKASDDLNCLICGKLWRSQHTDQERADCSAAL